MSTEEIKAELRALRAGRAVNASNLAARLGVHLQALCAEGNAAAVADPALLRQRVVAELNVCARHLPADLATAVRASLGLHAEAADTRFGGRVAWLARHLGREDRTALRRIDEAELLLAEQINTALQRRQASPLGDGWHVAQFDVLVRLDTPTVEVYEERQIVADRDGLDEITLGVNVPGPPHGPGLDLHAEVRHGARLIGHDRPLPHRRQLILALPRALAAGQSHSCGIISRPDPGQLHRPHYVLTATRPHDHFSLRIRFPLDRPPRWVRRVCGEPVRLLDEPRRTNDLLEPDPVGEVHTQFTQPAMYLAHGIQFWPATQP